MIPHDINLKSRFSISAIVQPALRQSRRAMTLFLLALGALFSSTAQAQVSCNQGTVPVPVVGNVNPTTGTSGTSITLSGANFGSENVTVVGFPVSLTSQRVYFGNGQVSDTATFSLSGANVVATAPANLAGPFNIIVQKRGGIGGLVTKCYQYTNAFSYLPVPIVLGVTPEQGVAQTVFSIAGLNFTNPSSVNIGGTPATSLQYQNEF